MAILYNASLPSSNFVTVVNTITNNLTGYVLNPNSANLVGASVSQNPQAALNALNTNPPCNASSIFQYNPVACYPTLINQVLIYLFRAKELHAFFLLLILLAVMIQIINRY